MLINLISSLFIRKTIQVEIDNVLGTELLAHSSFFSSCGTQNISFSLFDLINSIGTIQTRIDNPSTRIKFDVNSELFDWISPDNFFKAIIVKNDPDVKRRIAEDFGIGLAAVVTDKLFKIKSSTLTKISNTGRRPDFKCFTSLGKFVVVESKGSFYSRNRNSRIQRSLSQKGSVNADIKIASNTLLNTTDISNIKFIDPPVIPPDNPEYLMTLLKAFHYSKVFNYIGQKELSIYFRLMAKRIQFDRDFSEYNEKEELFEKIKREYLKIPLSNGEYLGRLDLIEDSAYVFWGFNKNLLSLNGFLHFQENLENQVISFKDNIFNITRDGLCFGLITSMDYLPKYINEAIHKEIILDKVKNYQDYTSIMDIDLMDEKSIFNYISYVLNQIGFKHSKINYLNDPYRGDITVIYKNNIILIEIKKVENNLSGASLKKIIKQNYKFPLMVITNGIVNENDRKLITKRRIYIVDRKILKKIIKDKKILLTIFKTLVKL